MPEYNNAAGRILKVLEILLPGSGQWIEFKKFAAAFGVTPSLPSLLTAVQDFHDEFELMCSDIEQVKDNPAKYNLYMGNLPDIERSVRSFNLHLEKGQCNCQISDKGVVALRFIAADLPQDETPELSDLNTIRELVNELQKEIEASAEFGKSVRLWLLDLVRIIRDSIDRFASRGSRGMRKQFAMLLGELMLNFDTAQNVRAEKPGIWHKFTSAIDLMNKLATLAEHCKPAVEFAQKYLPLFRSLGLPAPDDTNDP